MESSSENYPQYDGDNSKITAKEKLWSYLRRFLILKNLITRLWLLNFDGALTDKNLIFSFAHDVTWLNSVGIKVLVVHGGVA